MYTYEQQEFCGGDMLKTKVWHLRISRIFPLTVGVIPTVLLLNPDISIFHLAPYTNSLKKFNVTVISVYKKPATGVTRTYLAA